MVVMVLTACPTGLRGYLTRWLLEISAGVFVGAVSARVRDLMWQRTTEMVRSGRAIMVYSARNEQHLAFRVHGHHWKPVDFEGISLMLRPAETAQSSAPMRNTGNPTSSQQPYTGWSKAARRRKRM